MIAETKLLPYTAVLIKLLKGPVEYLERATWEKLVRYKGDLHAFLAPIGLTLMLDEEDGYAYLSHAHSEDEETGVSWIQRRPFTYEESIMLVLLREMMAEFETGEATTRELIRKRKEIKEYAELFFREKPSRVKFLKEIDRLIDKMEEHGFLHIAESAEMPDEQRFRIPKIIKARISAEVLDDFTKQLQHVKEQAVQLETGSSIEEPENNLVG
jgi:hypothetical protein